MPRTRMSLAVVTTVLLWSACQDGRPIVTVTDHDAGSGTAGAGGDMAGTGTAGTGNGGTAAGGAAATGAGGRGNAAGATAVAGTSGSAGTGGASGAAGAGQVGVGTLIDCPASPPSGACSVESMDCEYPNTTCRCTSKAWSCTACPATAQTTAGAAMCRYGTLTCSSWGCGACPDAHPTEGAACGNTKFKCQYGNDACLCGGDVEGWRCGTLSCPQSPSSSTRTSCATFALANGNSISFDYACSYQAENQTCSCHDGTGFGTLICNCPAALPAEGSACVGPSPCTYAGVTCNCTNNQWRCGGACPTSKPTAGASCSSQVSCSYANGAGTDYCSCNGSNWDCQ